MACLDERYSVQIILVKFTIQCTVELLCYPNEIIPKPILNDCGEGVLFQQIILNFGSNVV